MWYVETSVYSRLLMIAGESVELPCNTSLTADIMWTYDNYVDDGYVQYVYRNGRIDPGFPQLSVNSSATDYHSLVIHDVSQNNSGRYSCYDGGQRKIGYQLIIDGMCCINSVDQKLVKEMRTS